MPGFLKTVPALTRPDLLGPSVVDALRRWPSPVPVEQVEVAEIDPKLADTAAFCSAYAVPLAASANCVVVAGRRGADTRYAACVVLATTKADVNGLARRHLDARKCSFAPMDTAVAETGMEYGGITPLGLPDSWPILVDAEAAAADRVLIGSGLRRSKLWLPGPALADLPGAVVLHGLGLAG